MMESETVEMILQAKDPQGCRLPPETRRGKKSFFLQAFRESMSLLTP